MNPTTQNADSKFPFNSGPAMDNRTLYLTLVISACLGFVFILLLYFAVFGLNPINRMGYGFFMSVLPALGALFVVKFTRLFVSWRGAAAVYVALFVLTLIIQSFAR
jgi:hypothetical protein